MYFPFSYNLSNPWKHHYDTSYLLKQLIHRKIYWIHVNLSGWHFSMHVIFPKFLSFVSRNSFLLYLMQKLQQNVILDQINFFNLVTQRYRLKSYHLKSLMGRDWIRKIPFTYEMAITFLFNYCQRFKKKKECSFMLLIFRFKCETNARALGISWEDNIMTSPFFKIPPCK